MSYQVAAIRLLAASKGDNGGAEKAFRPERDFFEKSSKSPEIKAFTRARPIEADFVRRESGRKLPPTGKVIAALTR
ncbi:hypothetical protein [Sphingobium sp. TomTYG75]